MPFPVPAYSPKIFLLVAGALLKLIFMVCFAYSVSRLVTLMVQVGRFGLIAANKRRLMCLSMFWHFLDVVWIGVFTFVYLLGVLR